MISSIVLCSPSSAAVCDIGQYLFTQLNLNGPARPTESRVIRSSRRRWSSDSSAPPRFADLPPAVRQCDGQTLDRRIAIPVKRTRSVLRGLECRKGDLRDSRMRLCTHAFAGASETLERCAPASLASSRRCRLRAAAKRSAESPSGRARETLGESTEPCQGAHVRLQSTARLMIGSFQGVFRSESVGRGPNKQCLKRPFILSNLPFIAFSD